jgi:hypothetical protein
VNPASLAACCGTHRFAPRKLIEAFAAVHESVYGKRRIAARNQFGRYRK